MSNPALALADGQTTVDAQQAPGRPRPLGEPFGRTQVQSVQRAYRLVLPIYGAVSVLSVATLLRLDPALASIWAYQAAVCFVGFAFVHRFPAHTQYSMQRVFALLVLGFLARVSHAVGMVEGPEINLYSVTAPLVTAMVVTYTLFTGATARRVNQALAAASTLIAIISLEMRAAIHVEHVLSVLRFGVIAVGMTVLTQFMGELQLDHARLQAEHKVLARLALSDALTGLANRRAFEAVLAREIARAKRYGSVLSVLLIDIDCFKAINDRLGHEAGDAALAFVGRTLQRQLRTSDEAARWAGDEFAVILPSTPLEGGLVVAERIRAKLAAEAGAGCGPLTVSVGVAAFAAGSDDLAELMRRADQGLYRAKAEGRNRVAVVGA